MGQGLGKDSPVILTLGRANYEALIDRHGQWIRWRRAEKCPCVSYPSMQPDIHCELCGGRGELYGIQKDIVQVVTGPVLNSGIVELPEEYEDWELQKVYDVDGKEYYAAEKVGRYVTINDEHLAKYTIYSCVLKGTVAKSVEVAETEPMGNNFYKIKGIQTIKTGIDGIYYTGTPDIESIGKIVDANGVEYEAKEYRLDLFSIEPKIIQVENDLGEMIDEIQPIVEPVTVENVKYIPPFIFALLSQNLSQADGNAVVDAQGDAVCSFPYNCDVSEGDVLTVLTGTITEKTAQAKTEGDYDTLPAFFVSEIVSIIGLGENKERVDFVNGVDYILSGTNRIKWISDKQPLPGDAYSVIYKLYPTYKVIKDIPQLRTSENQRFPKKAVVKYMSTYSDNANINTQRRK